TGVCSDCSCLTSGLESGFGSLFGATSVTGAVSASLTGLCSVAVTFASVAASKSLRRAISAGERADCGDCVAETICTSKSFGVGTVGGPYGGQNGTGILVGSGVGIVVFSGP